MGGLLVSCEDFFEGLLLWGLCVEEFIVVVDIELCKAGKATCRFGDEDAAIFDFEEVDGSFGSKDAPVEDFDGVGVVADVDAAF